MIYVLGYPLYAWMIIVIWYPSMRRGLWPYSEKYTQAQKDEMIRCERRSLLQTVIAIPVIAALEFVRWSYPLTALYISLLVLAVLFGLTVNSLRKAATPLRAGA